MEHRLTARPAITEDAAAIARIYNEGIRARTATFETRLRTPEDIVAWFDGRHPVVVVEMEGEVVAFAASFPYSPRECYAGVAEIMAYVSEGARRRGAGRLATQALIREAERACFWKLLSKVFADNAPSLALLAQLGFRTVGVFRNHGQLDGAWRDVVIAELLFPRASS